MPCFPHAPFLPHFFPALTMPRYSVTSVFASIFQRLRPITVFFLIGLLILGLSRLGLAWWEAEDISAVKGWVPVFVQGLRVDIASLCMLYGIPGVLALLLPETGWVGRAWKGFLRLWLTLVTCVLAFLELSTPDFMEEYGLRPNRIFLEYLIYPREVANTLIKGHTFSLVLGIVLVALLAWGMWRLAGRLLARANPGGAGLLWRVPCAFLFLLLVAFGVRSTLVIGPLNPAMVAFTTDPTVNVLPLNSFYSVAYAARELLQTSIPRAFTATCHYRR